MRYFQYRTAGSGLSIPKVSIKQVKAARALLEWSQERLAEASGVSIPTIKRLEAQAGDLGGRNETVTKIVSALEVRRRGIHKRGRARRQAAEEDERMTRDMKVSAPLLAACLPLYATDPELRAAIFGARAKDPVCGGEYERLTNLPNFPKVRQALGGRHVPSVLAWFERYENGVVERAEPSDDERADRWERSGRRRGRPRKDDGVPPPPLRPPASSSRTGISRGEDEGGRCE